MRIDVSNAAVYPAARNLASGAGLPAFALMMDGASPELLGVGRARAGLAQQPPMAMVLMQMLGEPPPSNWRLRELDTSVLSAAPLPDPEAPQTLSMEVQLVSAEGHKLTARLNLSIFSAAREQAKSLVEALRRHDTTQMPGPIIDRPVAELAGMSYGFEWTADGRAMWQAQALAMRGWLHIRPRELPRKPGQAYQPAEPGEFDPEPPAMAAPANDDGAPTLGVGQWLWLSARSFGSWLKAYW